MNLLQNRAEAPVALRSIALFEIFKGVLAIAAVGGIVSLRNTDLHAAADAFLSRHHIDPEAHYTRVFIESVASLTHHHGGQIAAVGIVYAVIRFVEGYGLWHAKHWAEWFAVVSAGLYLPFEFSHLFRHPTAISGGVTILNIAIIYYLSRLLIRQRVVAKPGKLSLLP